MFIDKQDISYSIRAMRRAPVLTILVVLSMSIGIGLNAGVFTILNFLILQPPVKGDSSSFVQLFPRYEGWFTGARQFSSFTAGDYDALRTKPCVRNVAHLQAGCAGGGTLARRSEGTRTSSDS
jgi:hypothetical protein